MCGSCLPPLPHTGSAMYLHHIPTRWTGPLFGFIGFLGHEWWTVLYKMEQNFPHLAGCSAATTYEDGLSSARKQEKQSQAWVLALGWCSWWWFSNLRAPGIGTMGLTGLPGTIHLIHQRKSISLKLGPWVHFPITFLLPPSLPYILYYSYPREKLWSLIFLGLVTHENHWNSKPHLPLWWGPGWLNLQKFPGGERIWSCLSYLPFFPPVLNRCLAPSRYSINVTWS